MFFRTDVLKNFSKYYRKTTAQESLLNKATSPKQIFYRRLLQQLARTLNGIGPVKKSSQNEYISLKIESQHQVT